MRKWIKSALVGIGAGSVTLAMEPLFPLGDWRWIVVAVVAFVAAASVHYFPTFRWPSLRQSKRPKNILTDLEMEMLQFIAEAIRDRPVTTSAIITHAPFMDVHVRLTENSLINLRNLGYVVMAETRPGYYVVTEITGEGLKVART